MDTYSTMQKEALSGRELEASVLTRAALMLKNVQDNWDLQDRDQKLMEAIKFNQKVWSFSRQSFLTRKIPCQGSCVRIFST